MNSNSTRNPSGKAAFLGVMTAAALMLSYIESLFILVPGIPGIKLGFANLAVVLCLYRYGWKEALFLNAVRIALAAFLFGSMFTMLYSLAGAACAFAAMVLAKRLKLFSVVGVSVLGGVCHNLGQLGRLVSAVAYAGRLRDRDFYWRVRRGGQPGAAAAEIGYGRGRTHDCIFKRHTRRNRRRKYCNRSKRYWL